MSKPTKFKGLAKAVNKPKTTTMTNRTSMPALDLRRHDIITERYFNDVLLEYWNRGEQITKALVTHEQYNQIMRDWHWNNLPEKGTQFTYHSDFGDIDICIKDYD